MQDALSHFMRARLHAVTPSLAFLTRPSYVCSARIHATLGDQVEARRTLTLSSALPRTDALIESEIDAIAEPSEALLETNEQRALARFAKVSLRQVGELWPFYIRAMHLLLARAVQEAGRHARSARFTPAGAGFHPDRRRAAGGRTALSPPYHPLISPWCACFSPSDFAPTDSLVCYYFW
ncbi:MAG: hypothetical protein QM607_13050 [Microbacterium sp.]